MKQIRGIFKFASSQFGSIFFFLIRAYIPSEKKTKKGNQEPFSFVCLFAFEKVSLTLWYTECSFS